jgi:hypothetical protein
MKNRPCTWLDPFLPPVDTVDHREPLLAVPHGVHHPQGQTFLLCGSDDLSRALEVHRDRDLDQGVLAVLQRGQRHLGVGFTRASDDDDVDLGIVQGFPEVGGPFLVPVGVRELFGRRRFPTRGRFRGRFVGRWLRAADHGV